MHHINVTRSSNQKIIRFVQLTDCHLMTDSEATFGGIQPYYHLKAVVDDIQQDMDFDFLLATGDLAQQATAQAYQHYFDLISPLNKPHFCIRGNHDDCFVDDEQCCQIDCVNIGHWQILLLNSQKSAHACGELKIEDLEKLHQCLQHNAQLAQPKHIIITLHHHVLPVDSAWLDQHILLNAQAFLDIISPFKQVKLVLTGHVHQVAEIPYQHFSIMSCPATSVQFKPKQKEFAFDDLAPGYRRFELFDDGSYQSQVIYLSQLMGKIDHQITEY
ncbi:MULTISPECIES: metallophosphoesterase [unclassified Acinetobacter]|uniref:metallophosphoesterase n=1 Tax=unclassified Acinetobacter TaxID=196816 RepID=UPI0035B6F968